MRQLLPVLLAYPSGVHAAVLRRARRAAHVHGAKHNDIHNHCPHHNKLVDDSLDAG